MADPILVEPELNQYMIAQFKQFHQHPELCSQEQWTSKTITAELKRLGIPISSYPIKSGVIAEIGQSTAGPIIALRADIDALPLQEETDLSYQSKIPGVAHACGHDFHIAALLGAAKLLKDQEGQLSGRVRLIFEPGEERHVGAKEMIQAGVLKGVSAISGIHNMPTIPVGTVGMKVGKLMASNDNFDVTITGVGSHAAMPQTGRDPIVATANIIMTLQTIVSRNISPSDRLVLTIGAIRGGQTNNVIPETAGFKGTIRTFSAADRALAKKRFYEIVDSTAKAYGQTAAITWDEGPAPVDNSKIMTDLIAEEAHKFMTVIPAIPSNADDDFAEYEQLVPGCYAFMGSKDQANLHHPDFIANPDGLQYAAKFHEQAALTLLNYFNQKGKVD
ncbi:M20 metallopeptidase family protein [Lentilactobacillus parabuchneri]|uniref:M20 metallopeptidase family protein n=1 Tax=Lentilactobacillus parabuchneri TaxID=152331 RepID=UPI002306FD41|nr:amidohydrolase [Lentilactobacillus parabuchneri]MDB1103191.1 amidohydrolase [Lentilactobacillus parabuchneri]